MDENEKYWRTRSGYEYAAQQRIRRSSGNESYAQQEAWLTARVQRSAVEARRPIRVLDFGAGFGRMARVLGALPSVEYFAFDVSRTMVEPIVEMPPDGLSDIARRILIADSLDDVGDLPPFDLVFTVSVLIHNEPAVIDAILGSIRRRLAPAGRICLIENRPVALGFKANRWHAGCWVHDFAFVHHGGMSVAVDDTSVPGHGVYELSVPEGERRVSWVEGGESRSIEHAGWLLRTLEFTRSLAATVDPEPSVLASEMARARDCVELVNALQARLTPRDGLLSEIERLRDEATQAGLLREQVRDATSEADRLREEINSLAAIRDASAHELTEYRARIDALTREVDELKAESARLRDTVMRQTRVRRALTRATDREVLSGKCASSGVVPPVERLPFVFNHPRDTAFANELPGFDHVAHVAHQEWFGIRAAAGALPGQKLMVSADHRPSERDIESAVRKLEGAGAKQLVVHGFSESMEAWVRALREAGFARIGLVWHGAPAMWLHDPENRIFGLARKLTDHGVIARAHVMRPGNESVFGARGWASQLYNMPPVAPRTLALPRRPRGGGRSVLIPSWHLLHKNLVTNVLAAANHEAVGEVLVLARDFRLPVPVKAKVECLGQLDARAILEAMASADVVSNVSLIDCHPMVELEALAVGTPCLRGRLALDCLEDHPYVSATQVSDPLSISSIRVQLDRVLAIPAADMAAMLADYRAAIVALSADRYRDFLGAY